MSVCNILIDFLVVFRRTSSSDVEAAQLKVWELPTKYEFWGLWLNLEFNLKVRGRRLILKHSPSLFH